MSRLQQVLLQPPLADIHLAPQAASHAKLDALHAVHATKNALEKLRVAESTVLFAKHGQRKEDALRWMSELREEYTHRTRNETHFNTLYRDVNNHTPRTNHGRSMFAGARAATIC